MIFSDSKVGIPELAHTLNSSEPVVIPTETVYGLAAKIDDSKSLEKIFLYKKRPFFDPLIVHVYDRQQVKMLSHFDSPILTQLMNRFWPGPLTMVLPKLASVSDVVTSGLDSVGVRMPNHPLALKLLEAVGVPLAAPSANLFGQTSPTTAQHVEVDFPQLKILDGGSCDVGIESTVLKIQPLPEGRAALSILRKGLVTHSAIQSALMGLENFYEWSETLDKKHSPGHMKHHYMPKTPIVFFDHPIHIDDHLTQIQNDFKNTPDIVEDVKIIKPSGELRRIETLSFNTDPTIACRELYGVLKTKSQLNAQILVFEKHPYMTGEVWDAFLERLSKAASLRYN